MLVNLRDLACGFFECYLDVAPFFGPKLSRFSIVIRDNASVASASALASLKILVPHLEHLRVLSCSGHLSLSQMVCGVVCSLHHLFSLDLTNILLTSECITHL